MPGAATGQTIATRGVRPGSVEARAGTHGGAGGGRGRGVGRRPGRRDAGARRPRKNSVSWSGGVGRDPTAVTVGAGSVWVAGGEEGNVARIDPDGPRVVERRATGSSP